MSTGDPQTNAATDQKPADEGHRQGGPGQGNLADELRDLGVESAEPSQSESQPALQASITPTVGRVVHYFDGPTAKERAAIICCVHNDTCVNLTVFDHNGTTFAEVDAYLVQPHDERPSSGCFCEWMAYQVKKQAGSESGERAAGTEAI